MPNKLVKKSSGKKKSLKNKLYKKRYKELIQMKKSKKISKKNNKILDNELQKKYCKCIKTLKKKYSKKSKVYKNKYGICMNSIYNTKYYINISIPYRVYLQP